MIRKNGSRRSSSPPILPHSTFPFGELSPGVAIFLPPDRMNRSGNPDHGPPLKLSRMYRGMLLTGSIKKRRKFRGGEPCHLQRYCGLKLRNPELPIQRDSRDSMHRLISARYQSVPRMDRDKTPDASSGTTKRGCRFEEEIAPDIGAAQISGWT